MDVLRAAPILRERGVAFEMDFVGRWGSDADRLSFGKTVQEYRLNAAVRYHGGIEDRSTIREFYRKCDVLVLPSYHPTEAQPLALIEALNAGVPIVTTGHGGIPFVVRHEREGLYVPPRSPATIADAVARFSDIETWSTFSERAREAFVSRFSPERIGSKWSELVR